MNEIVNADFMGYKAMCHCRPIIKREHNKREQRIVQAEKHIDLTRPHETILDLGDLDTCYQKIFGTAVENFNAKQKRKDRRINNYLQKILNDNRHGVHKNKKADGSRKPAYEMIIQLGNRDNKPNEEKTTEVLKSFCDFIPKKYPNIVPIGIYLHNDEFSVDEETRERINSPCHIHFDFVYIAHLGKSLKTGMELQSSMSGALAEMGFVTRKGKGTAQTQFEEAVRHDLQDFAQQRGILIDRSPGVKHRHDEKDVYQKKRENEKKEKKLHQREELFYREVKKEQEKLNKERQQIEKDKARTESELNRKKSAYLQEKELFEMNRHNQIAYNETTKMVKENSIKIDTEVEQLKNGRLPFAERLASFVSNVKKIVTSLSCELIKYKKTFSSFWKKESNDFRTLADLMDRNKCKTFLEFIRKHNQIQTDYQIRQKQQIQEKYKLQNRKIESYEI